MKLRVLGFASLLSCGIAFGGDPSPPLTLDHALPADVWAYIGCDDVKGLVAGVESTELGRLFADPKFAPVRDAVVAMFETMRKEAAEKGGPDPLEFLQLLDGPSALAVLDPSAFDPEYVFGEAEYPPLLFLFGAEGHAPELLAKIEDSVGEDVAKGKVVKETREIAGIAVEVFDDKPDDAKPSELAIGMVGSTVFVLGSDLHHAKPERLESVVRGLAGEPHESLADSPFYKSAQAGPGGGGALHAFVNVGSILASALKHAHESGIVEGDSADEDTDAYIDDPDSDGAGDDEGEDYDEDMDEADDEPESHGISLEGAQKLEALGLQHLGYFALQFTPAATGSSAGLELSMEDSSVLTKLLERLLPSGKFGLASKIPVEARNAMLFHVDFPAAIESLGEFLDVVEPDAASEMRSGLEEAKVGGFDLQTQLLALLGREVAVFRIAVKDENQALPGSEDDPSNVGFIVELKDGAALETSLEALLKGQGLDAIRRRTEFEGRVIFTIPTPLGIEVSYSLTNDQLVISAAREIVEDVLRRSGDSKLPSLASDESIKAGFAALGESSQSIVSEVDSATYTSAFLAGMRQGLVLRKPEIESTLGSITADDIKKYITGRAVSGLSIDARGIRVRALWLNEKQ